MYVCIAADLHSRHREIIWPKADVLVIAGDLVDAFKVRNYKINYQITTLEDLDFMLDPIYKHVLVTGGNHDFALEEARHRLKFKKIQVLENRSCTINGKTFYGSPWNMAGMAFDKRSKKDAFTNIPEDLYILFTHVPPGNIFGTEWGDPELLEIIRKVKPKIHIFGHDHINIGTEKIDDTLFINASIMARTMREPVVINI